MTGTSTRAEAVYAKLRADILAARWFPGQRLPFDELCAHYDASVGVVREALQRLAEQGLVLAEPNRGFRVVPASEEDLRWLTEARIEIEPLTLRRAVQQGDLTWETRVLAAHHRLDRTPMADAMPSGQSDDAWIAAHNDFHRTLIEGCENLRLRSIAAALRDSFELYRRWSLAAGQEKHRDVPGEHRKLLDFVLARDAEGAAAAIRSHIELTKILWTEQPEAPEQPAPKPRRRRAPRPTD